MLQAEYLPSQSPAEKNPVYVVHLFSCKHQHTLNIYVLVIQDGSHVILQLAFFSLNAVTWTTSSFRAYRCKSFLMASFTIEKFFFQITSCIFPLPPTYFSFQNYNVFKLCCIDLEQVCECVCVCVISVLLGRTVFGKNLELLGQQKRVLFFK